MLDLLCNFVFAHPVTSFGLLWLAVAVVDHFTTEHTKEVR